MKNVSREAVSVPFYLSINFAALVIVVANAVMLLWVGPLRWWIRGLSAGVLTAVLGGAWLVLTYAITKRLRRSDLWAILGLVVLAAAVTALRAIVS